MIFKVFKNIVHYIECAKQYDETLEPIYEQATKALSEGFIIKEIQYMQDVTYRAEIVGDVKPLLGEMIDTKAITTNNGKKVCPHILSFIVKKLADGSYITPDNVVFTIDESTVYPGATRLSYTQRSAPKSNVYKTIKIREIIKVNSINDVDTIARI